MKPLALTDCSSVNQTSIVISRRAGEHERAAARELRRYLAKLSGAGYGTSGTNLAILTDDREITGAFISLGENRYAEKEGIHAAGLAPEGFRIRRVGNGLFLVGDGAGTRFAAYHFLEEVLGVRWLWPGPTGEDVPVTPCVRVGDIDIEQRPSFVMRHLGQHHQTPWGMRNRLGGSLAIHGVHAFGAMVPPGQHGRAHPEYFALVKGKRQCGNFDGKHGCQLCVSNPDVIELCVRYVRRFFDSSPAGAVFNISPNDGGGFCECPACRKLDKGRECDFNGRKLPSASGQIFSFANKIGAAIAKSHPGRQVAMLAYHQYLNPPPAAGFRLRPNVILQLCLNCDADHDPAHLEKAKATLRGWAGRAHAKAIYEYLVWRGNASLPRPLVSVVPAALRRYYRSGCRLFHSQAYDDFGASGLNYYLAAKLLWNINADEQSLLKDYFTRGYGSAAGPARKYHELLDGRWEHAVKVLGAGYYMGSPAYYLEMFDRNALKKMSALVSEAQSAAKSYAIKARVGRLALVNEYVRKTMLAIGSLAKLQKAGLCRLNPAWPTRIEAKPLNPASKFDAEWEQHPDQSPARSRGVGKISARKSLPLVEEALDAWGERNRFVEDIRPANLIDYWHVRRDVDRDYRNDPTAQLLELKARCAGG